MMPTARFMVILFLTACACERVAGRTNGGVEAPPLQSASWAAQQRSPLAQLGDTAGDRHAPASTRSERVGAPTENVLTEAVDLDDRLDHPGVATHAGAGPARVHGRHAMRSWKRGARDPVLYLRESPGYTTVEAAERFAAHPYKFVLYGDGRVEYRDGEFNIFTVQLEDEDVEALLGRIVDLGFLEADAAAVRALDEATGGGTMVIADAGGHTIGLKLSDRQNEIILDAALRIMCRKHPDDDNAKAILGTFDILQAWEHARAEKVEDGTAAGGP